MVAKDSSLTTSEKRRLEQHETTIESGLRSFVDVGKALLSIKTDRLFTDVGETFEEYCRKRWGFAKSRAYQLIESAKVVGVVSTIVENVPTNEAQARVLASLPSEQVQATVWAKAVETAPKDKDGEPKVTAAHVQKVANEIAPKPLKPDAPPTAEPVAEEPAVAPPKEEPKPLLDGLKNPVPKKLASVFEKAGEFEQQLTALNAIIRWVEATGTEPHGTHIHVQSLVADLNNAKRAIKFAKPYSPCPYCKTGKADCECCKGSGFVGKNKFKAAPADMKE